MKLKYANGQQPEIGDAVIGYHEELNLFVSGRIIAFGSSPRPDAAWVTNPVFTTDNEVKPFLRGVVTERGIIRDDFISVPVCCLMPVEAAWTLAMGRNVPAAPCEEIKGI